MKEIPRGRVSRRREAESVIKRGDMIHAALVAGLFIAPLAICGRSILFDEGQSITSLVQLIFDNLQMATAIAFLALVSAFAGYFFQQRGYRMLDRLELEET